MVSEQKEFANLSHSFSRTANVTGPWPEFCSWSAIVAFESTRCRDGWARVASNGGVALDEDSGIEAPTVN